MAKMDKTKVDSAQTDGAPIHRMDSIENPVLADAVSEQLIDVTVNEDGEVFVFYDRPFPEEISWVEYDEEFGRLDFMSKEGRIRFFGVSIPKDIKDVIMQAKEAYFIEVGEDGNSVEQSKKSVVIRKDIGI